jgi:hypothetical protein
LKEAYDFSDLESSTITSTLKPRPSMAKPPSALYTFPFTDHYSDSDTLAHGRNWFDDARDSSNGWCIYGMFSQML